MHKSILHNRVIMMASGRGTSQHFSFLCLVKHFAQRQVKQQVLAAVFYTSQLGNVMNGLYSTREDKHAKANTPLLPHSPSTKSSMKCFSQHVINYTF